MGTQLSTKFQNTGVPGGRLCWSARSIPSTRVPSPPRTAAGSRAFEGQSGLVKRGCSGKAAGATDPPITHHTQFGLIEAERTTMRSAIFLPNLMWSCTVWCTEASHSGLVRTLGKRVGGNLSRVRISPPPQERETVLRDATKPIQWSNNGTALLEGDDIGPPGYDASGFNDSMLVVK
jgi:hypothetical protein